MSLRTASGLSNKLLRAAQADLFRGTRLSYNRLVDEYKKNAVTSASPLKLVVMLYDGALRFMEQGKDAVLKKDFNRQNEKLQRAQRIVLELMAALDTTSGGDIANNLMSLYSFIVQQLINANIHDQVEPIEASMKILTDLRASWITLEEQLRQPTEPAATAAQAA